MSAAVTIAVISWNTRDLLARCLTSMRPEHEAGRAEVWVVDNGSTDGSPELVEAEYPWVRLICPDENLGFGRAVNLVAEQTTSPWIAPANADVELRADTLSTLLETGGDGAVGAVAPRLIMPDGTTQHSVHPFPSVPLAVVVQSGLASAFTTLGDRLCLEGSWNSDRSRDVDWAHGAFLLVRRRAFEEVGGFDARQWMYAEDLDIGWRLRDAGWRLTYEPAAPIRHEVSAATKQAFTDDREERHIAAAYAWMARRRGMASTWGYAGLNVGGSSMRWLFLSFAAKLSPERFEARRDLARYYASLHRLGLRRRSRLLAAAGAAESSA